jgi:hypothetical protein
MLNPVWGRVFNAVRVRATQEVESSVATNVTHPIDEEDLCDEVVHGSAAPVGISD